MEIFLIILFWLAMLGLLTGVYYWLCKRVEKDSKAYEDKAFSLRYEISRAKTAERLLELQNEVNNLVPVLDSHKLEKEKIGGIIIGKLIQMQPNG